MSNRRLFTNMNDNINMGSTYYIATNDNINSDITYYIVTNDNITLTLLII